ncbi:MAG: hypothetical protein GXP02_04625, partial [Alphaproteobacteria bacterium]|nr:hypothetical protein [Alphaproteobacteria bacterium]
MLIKNMLTGLTGALIDLGEHPGQFAKRADFPETWLYDPNEMIDPNEWARIINMAAEVFNCRD